MAKDIGRGELVVIGLDARRSAAEIIKLRVEREYP